jgi:ABC-type multidrug transport system fused ATPase/permease subunit
METAIQRIVLLAMAVMALVLLVVVVMVVLMMLLVVVLVVVILVLAGASVVVVGLDQPRVLAVGPSSLPDRYARRARRSLLRTLDQRRMAMEVLQSRQQLNSHRHLDVGQFEPFFVFGKVNNCRLARTSHY